MSKTILIIVAVFVILAGLLLFLHALKKKQPEQATIPLPNASVPSSQLSWITTKGNSFVDSSGKPVLLRGFVTITGLIPSAFNNGGGFIDYTNNDYTRMKSLGANVQSIRIGLGALTTDQGSYMNRLQSMVSEAAQEGIYSEFKLTTYDVSGFLNKSTKGQYWAGVWNNTQGSQDKIITAWKKVWIVFKDNPSVVGYDLFNEPEKGDLAVDDNQFVSSYLNPFYQKLIDNLRQIDSQHLVFFQSAFNATELTYLPYSVSIAREKVVYAPHFYPNIKAYFINGEFLTTDYDTILNRYLTEAQANNAPLFIGEYGMPWDPKNDSNVTLQSKFQTLEKTATSLFVQHSLSFTRPWYADDRAGVTIGNISLDWSVIQGQTLDGPFRAFITDTFTSAAR